MPDFDVKVTDHFEYRATVNAASEEMAREIAEEMEREEMVVESCWTDSSSEEIDEWGIPISDGGESEEDHGY